MPTDNSVVEADDNEGRWRFGPRTERGYLVVDEYGRTAGEIYDPETALRVVRVMGGYYYHPDIDRLRAAGARFAVAVRHGPRQAQSEALAAWEALHREMFPDCAEDDHD